ncbi:MAG: FkbM family methyltransferase [Bacteroidales bacterium]
MIHHLKHILKSILFILHVDLTRNQQYDRQTLKIMKRVLRQNSSCIDVGCHKGEMLDHILIYSPKGTHWAFEPLPAFYEFLKNKYRNRDIRLYPYALSDEKKTVTFHHVTNDPAFSGIRQRKYHCQNPVIEKIEVETECLDNIITEENPIDFIKIDVEGGEYGVLCGSKTLLKRDKPIVIFEFGLGAADYYDTTAEMMFDLFAECGLKVSLMKDYLDYRGALLKESFVKEYQTGNNYYFIAHP